MSASNRATRSASTDVDQFLDALDHPLKPEMQALRRIILGVDPAIAESIKWNAPSFATREHFATFQLRAQDCIRIVLHLGARTRDAPARLVIDDPAGMLSWASGNRALVAFSAMSEVTSRQKAFEHILRQWISYV
ncbi:MAG TPA: DUF1801 domain-containing protein [Roseiflexaceae bacterium]|nr:DUF1801 domain-containing protein [Roseiflexaceae bacterium]